jgi:PAS domain S-box-containing protein
MPEVERQKTHITGRNTDYPEDVWRVINLIPIPVILFSPQHEILAANQAFIRSFGFKLSELKGQKPPFSFWKAAKSGYYKNTFFKTDSQPRQWLIQSNEGEEVWVEITNQIWPAGPKSSSVLAYFQDVTEKKKTLEEAKSAAEKMQKTFDAVPILSLQ